MKKKRRWKKRIRLEEDQVEEEAWVPLVRKRKEQRILN
jgi:hypothetical protein